MKSAPNDFDFFYPGCGDNPDHCFVNLMHVRAASPLKIEFDFKANMWVTSILRSDDVDDNYHEVARLPAWFEDWEGHDGDEGG